MLKFANNAYGTLSANILLSDTTISLTTGHGARFPTLGAQDYFYATLVDTSGNLEIIKVTARATDSLTAVRGQDGTTARGYSTGDRLELRPCNAMLTALQQEAVVATTGTGTDTYTATLAPVPSAYNSDQVYAIKIPNANTSATPTLNLNSLGAKTIKKGNSAALSPGDLQAGMVGLFHYNGTDMILLNPAKAVLRGKQTIWVPAGAIVPRTTNGAAGPNQTETSTNKVNVRTLDFDQATQQHGDFVVSMPKGWDLGTVTAKFLWTAAAGTGGQGCVWGIQGVALSDNDALDTAFGTAQEVTDALQTTNNVHISADTGAMTIGASPAARDLVVFQVYRKAADGADTLAATALLLGVELTVNFSAADDS
jgi:hypothetical protein